MPPYPRFHVYRIDVVPDIRFREKLAGTQARRKQNSSTRIPYPSITHYTLQRILIREKGSDRKL